MKCVICDICRRPVVDTEESYQFKLKRKYFAAHYEGGAVYPDKTLCNTTIDMCGKCFRKFQEFCNKKEEE